MFRELWQEDKPLCLLYRLRLVGLSLQWGDLLYTLPVCVPFVGLCDARDNGV